MRLQTRAGTTYSSAPSALLVDARGPMVGVPVTFSFPSSGATATFPEGGATWTGPTDAQGRVTAPIPTAGETGGAFALTVAADGADQGSVPMSAQLGFTAFGSPVSSKGTVSTNRTSAVPLKLTALDAGRRAMDDDRAAQLVADRRVRVVWARTKGSVGPVTGYTDTLVRYVGDKDLLQADIKPSALGWGKGTYEVRFVVLASRGDTPAVPVLNLGVSSTVTLPVS